LLQRGDVDYPLWTRSLLKPIQLASHFQILKESYPRLRPEHFALMSSSHNCEESHMRLLLEIMEIGRVNPSQLRCPPAMPSDACTREHYKQEGKEPSSLYHNCSGKHFSYLMSLQAQGKSVDNYTDFDNIEHTRVEKLLAELVNRPPDSFAKTTDGCQLPNHALSIREMATVYQKLAKAAGDLIADQPEQLIAAGSDDCPSETANGLGYIGSLMRRFPHILGGNDRLDTKIMSDGFTGGGAVKYLAKDGAEGLLALSVLPTEVYKSGLGIVIKLSSGYDIRHMETLASEILHRLGLMATVEKPQPAKLRTDHLKTEFIFELNNLSPDIKVRS
jgi:L-asparaginase II